VLVAMIVLFSHLALAEPYVVVFSDTQQGSIYDIAVVEENGFGNEYSFEVDDSELVEEYKVEARDSSGNVLSSGDIISGRSELDFDIKTAGVVLMSAGTVVAERKLSFCDSDKLCEPCTGSSCSLIENYLTCADCSSGSDDYFCDTLSDGICDPDCDFDPADPDCVLNCTEYCGVDIADVLSCSDYDGEICSEAEDCIGGMMLDTADSMYCCYGGFCGVTGEYVETSVELQRQPSSTITPTGVLASTVQATGVSSYCANTIGGVLCPRTSTCTGNLLEFYHNTFCCIGP